MTSDPACRLKCPTVCNVKCATNFTYFFFQEQAFPLTEKFCLILSSSQFVVDMLNNWNEIPLFLQLQHEKNKMQPVTPSSGEIKGLFHDISGGFDFLVIDLIKTLSEFVFYEVKSRSRSYRCDVKWFSYVLYNEAPFDNTPESFPMFQVSYKLRFSWRQCSQLDTGTHTYLPFLDWCFTAFSRPVYFCLFGYIVYPSIKCLPQDALITLYWRSFGGGGNGSADT